MDNFVLSINGDIPRSTVRMYKNNENVKKKTISVGKNPFNKSCVHLKLAGCERKNGKLKE